MICLTEFLFKNKNNCNYLVTELSLATLFSSLSTHPIVASLALPFVTLPNCHFSYDTNISYFLIKNPTAF